VNSRYEQTIKLFRDTASDGFSFNPATNQELSKAEKELNVNLPESYKAFQLELGDIDWAMLEIYSVKTPQEGMTNIIGITQSERTECFPNMPNYLVPFSDNGGGDSYCFDTSKITDGECPVVFWDHTSTPKQEPEVVAVDFLEWIGSEIKWRQEADAE
jgi:hypothetical protein